jgi:hypothetical protein
VERTVFVPPEFIKTVVFLGMERESGFHLGGTGFLVSEELPGTSAKARYIVTAAHIVDEIKERTTDGSVYVRANSPTGGITLLRTEISHWICHKEPQIDVAGIAMGDSAKKIDQLYVNRQWFATDEVISQKSIGPGTDLIFPGLFTRHSGTDRNIPIVRIGSLAAIPNEKVKTKRGMMPAYLAEARSIGGFSGSPVFAAVDNFKVQGGIVTGLGSTFYFLGMIHGHYGINESNWDYFDPEIDSRDDKSLNMGIAILVTAKDVSALLDQPEFQAERERARQESLSQEKCNLPTS